MARAIERPLLTPVIDRLPGEMIDRYRLLVMMLALTSTLATFPAILSNLDTSALLRVFQIALLTMVFWRWTRWYRNRAVHSLDLVLELTTVAAVTYLLNDSSSALTFVYTGVYLRPLFTNNRQTTVAAAGYAATFLAALIAADIQGRGEVEPTSIGQVVALIVGAAVVRTVAISLHRNAEMTSNIERAEREYRTLIEQLPGAVISFDYRGHASYVSPRIQELLKYSPEEFIDMGIGWAELIHEDDRPRVMATVTRCLETREPLEWECRVNRADGATRWFRFEARTIDENGTEDSWRGLLTDVTEQHRLSEKLSHQAFHDALTDLPNRSLFEERLKHTIDMQSRRGNLHAVLFLDLDNFKVVNDSLGHSCGDQLLISASERIRSCLRSGDTVARFGGDEFAILLEDLQDRSEAGQISERIGSKLAAPFHLNDVPAYVSASIGITFNRSGSASAEDLIRQADVAMYEAKHSGKARNVVFENTMERRAWERLQSEADLRSAFERQEFTVNYQPVVDLQSGAIREVEALVRWNHPTRGQLAPGDFLPLAEEVGLMARLDAWVLRQACQQVRAWQLRYPEYSDLIVSVNASPALLQSQDLASTVERILDETGLPPRFLRLEVTESAMLSDVEKAQAAISQLHALGVHIAIDDFGTGNSAVSFLRKLPVDTLKIDRSYVADIDENPDALKLMTAVIYLAKSLGLSVTAEGIEHRNQTHLQSLGCDLGQGFYFSRPLPTDQVEALLTTNEPFVEHLDREDLRLLAKVS